MSEAKAFHAALMPRLRAAGRANVPGLSSPVAFSLLTAVAVLQGAAPHVALSDAQLCRAARVSFPTLARYRTRLAAAGRLTYRPGTKGRLATYSVPTDNP